MFFCYLETKTMIFQRFLYSEALFSRAKINLMRKREFAQITCYESFLTETSKNRKPSAIRALQQYLNRPNTISLGGGMPNSKTFPFASLYVELSPEYGEKVTIPISSPTDAFQYSSTAGIPGLVNCLRELQMVEHCKTDKDKLDILLTTGSQDVLTKSFEMLLSPGDTLLVEDYTYSGSLAFLRGLDTNLCPVDTDTNGIVPQALSKILSNWDDEEQRKPRVLYSIPTGSNPTGLTIPLERRHELYHVCSEHNILILEDDPYYFLQFGEQRLPSLLSIDTEGRVLRFDSLSKVLSSGLRLGFATGPEKLLERLNLHVQCTSLHTSGVSQSVVLALFEYWKKTENLAWEGFNTHVDGICNFYKRQRDLCVQLATKHLSPYAKFSVPDAGMFLWIELKDGSDSASFVQKLVEEDRVLVVPGFEFDPIQGKRNNPYFRISYSTANKEQVCRYILYQ
uniref:Aminotransferase class I/classII large domain-containing protein n=1 Tax=Aplanochytrium stocchinoi TaxID=215587 RepID=A0A7S3PEL7_9STRA